MIMSGHDAGGSKDFGTGRFEVPRPIPMPVCRGGTDDPAAHRNRSQESVMQDRSRDTREYMRASHGKLRRNRVETTPSNCRIGGPRPLRRDVV